MTKDDAPLAGRISDGVHILPVRVYYEDTDFSGLVYHANYLRFMERGRSDSLRCAGINHKDLLALDEPLAFTVQRIDVEFLRPARIDDLLEVRTRYTVAKGARIAAKQVILRDGEEIVRADVFAACISMEGRPRRLPDFVVAAMTPHLSATGD